MSRLFRAVHTASCLWHKLRVPLIERSFSKDEQDIVLNPRLKMTDWKEDALRFPVAIAPVFPKAGRECLFLLTGLQLGQQERVADTNLILIGSGCSEFTSYLSPGCHECKIALFGDTQKASIVSLGLKISSESCQQGTKVKDLSQRIEEMVIAKRHQH
ncbi:hypothetical protein H7849_05550 [Alloacidobacterium dinghuense]|uniref:Uncharacterized protein n=1 Tax=Alloacidobacterium dinghuense TaxID=2763107 RepID=A0A7G8BLJ6_9BACT|nr:hypothetical protein H7849_05550 [Alloacidobacterium dinghuense]